MFAKFRAAVCLLFLVSTVAACGAGRGGTSRSGRWDMLTREQLLESNHINAYEAVQAMRANWLSTRGVDSIEGTPSQVLVYLDDQRLGGVETLRTIPMSSVHYMRHYSAPEASARWGLGHGAGAILVFTKVGP